MYRHLDSFYRPVGKIGTSDETLPPAYPRRVRAFIYACAKQALDDEVRLHGGKPKGQQAPLKRRAPSGGWGRVFGE